MSQKAKGILNLLASFFFFLLIGASYNWGVISDYYSSFLFKHTNNENSFSLVKLGVSLLFFFQYTTMCFDSYIVYSDIKTIILISLCLNLFTCLILLFFSNLFIFFCLMALIGIANGMVYLKLIKNAWLYFPKFKGQISGVILCGSGLSSFFLNPIAHYIINPTKLGYDYKNYYLFSIPERMQCYFIFLFVFFAVFGLIGYFFTYKYEEEEDKHEVDENSEVVSNANNNQREVTLEEGLKTITFYELALIIFSLAFYTAFLAITFPSYSRYKGMDEFLVIIACLGFPFINGFCRNIWGILVDNYKFKTLCYSLLTLQFLSIIMIVFITNQYVIFSMILIGAFCLSGVLGVMPPTFNKIYGQSNGAELFGIGMFSFGFTSLFCSFLITFNIELETIYFISGCITIFGFLSLTFLDETPKISSSISPIANNLNEQLINRNENIESNI